jgi:hypothetical protein
MIDAARVKHADWNTASFMVASAPPPEVDFCIASGIFNVRLGADDAAWRLYIAQTLETMHRSSSYGFAFNCLTSYSDPDRMRDDLHYADPCELFDHCKRRFSKDVALLHDYGLYEFTMLVRKQPEEAGT